MRTGIFGGTFDPIHVAHLHAGETALFEAGLDRVLFIPAGDPWQKDDRHLTPATHRLAMVELAVAGVEGLEADDREIRRGGPSYTIDTLGSFPADDDLFVVVGADAAAGFRNWRRWEEIVDRARILIVPRPGTDPALARQALPDAAFLEMAVLDISATEIRRRAAKGEPYRFLVPPAVYEYIETNDLYAHPSTGDRVGPSNEQEDSS